MLDLTVSELKKMLQKASPSEFQALERSLAADTRKGVRNAIDAARKRIDAELAEARRLDEMYEFEVSLARDRSASVVIGLDEVGRGPLAGPLAIGAVVLPPETRIAGLNDSKQLKAEVRERLAEEIKEKALAWSVQYIQPHEIDAAGMTACLITAFRRAVAAVEQMGVEPDLILLDGNPLRMDKREVNVVKGDARCPSIAAASIVAKVERDALMKAYAIEYPEYGFDSNKGYASADHMAAIEKHGLSPIHRVSFCTAFTQPSLF